ncbi:uncharacterized protein LOC144144183 [Haemaphysalis longicornis]
MNRIQAFLKNFLLENHKHDLEAILASDDDRRHYCVRVNGTTLFDASVEFGESLLYDPVKTLDSMNVSAALALKQALEECPVPDKYCLKDNVHLRLINLPQFIQTATLPKCKQVSRFQAITGTVLRMKGMKVLERSRDYLCSSCGHSFTVKAEITMFCMLTKPSSCPNPMGCRSTKFVPSSNETDLSRCSDYQEVLVQEKANNLVLRNVPGSIWVVLEDDLVDCCKPGQDVVVSGILSARQHKFVRGQRPDVNFVFIAHNVEVAEEQCASLDITAEVKKEFKEFWEEHRDTPLAGRDLILASVCPQVYGLYLVKLAVSLILAGGVRHCDESGTRIRGESHLLLVGDPGTAKSQFLKYAAKMSARSVLTTGIGSTSAGLTAAAIKDGGEWQLEAGALVLADGGVCCIDEFNSIREHDRGSIHEAMEQQTISVAKAGLVTKLSTRCSILAAANPKGSCSADGELDVNTGIASPLLSRFDLVLVLKDSHNQDWDRLVSKFILQGQDPLEDREDTGFWSISKMRSYFLIVKALNPTLTEEAQMVLQEYYRCQRNVVQRDAARTTLRLLESLVRLSQGHARLMFREEVGVQDAVVAVALMEVSMQSSALVGNVDALHTGFAKNPEREYRNQARIILGRLGLHDILERELSRSSEKSFPSLQKNDANSTSPVQHAGGRHQNSQPSNNDVQTQRRSSDDSAATSVPQQNYTQRAGSQTQTSRGQHRNSENSGRHGEHNKSNGDPAKRKRPEDLKGNQQLASASAQHVESITEDQGLEDFGSNGKMPVQAGNHRQQGSKKKGKHALGMATQASSETEYTPECDEAAPAADKNNEAATPTDVPHRQDMAEFLKTFICKPRKPTSGQEKDPVLLIESSSENEQVSAKEAPEKPKKSSASASKSTQQGETAKSTSVRQKKSPCRSKSRSGDKLDPAKEVSVQAKKKAVSTSGSTNASGNLTADCESVQQSSSHRDISERTEVSTGIVKAQMPSDANVPKEQRKESNPAATPPTAASGGVVSKCREKLKKFARSPRATETPVASAVSTMVPYDTTQTNSSAKGDTSASEVATNAPVNGTASFLNQKWPTTQELTTSHILGTIGDDGLGLDDDDWMFDRGPTKKRQRTSDE